mmetsp:Transcript_93324/g.237523  ORF Transcript_93324/g.237523 Transcript_93324/m.237523 type:complete len:200 (+) Transcript_93324:490-1089(+)
MATTLHSSHSHLTVVQEILLDPLQGVSVSPHNREHEVEVRTEVLGGELEGPCVDQDHLEHEGKALMHLRRRILERIPVLADGCPDHLRGCTQVVTGILQCVSILSHSLEHDVGIPPQRIGCEPQSPAPLSHSCSHHGGVGTQVLRGELQRVPLLLNSFEHDLEVGSRRCFGVLKRPAGRLDSGEHHLTIVFDGLGKILQ